MKHTTEASIVHLVDALHALPSYFLAHMSSGYMRAMSIVCSDKPDRYAHSIIFNCDEPCNSLSCMVRTGSYSYWTYGRLLWKRKYGKENISVQTSALLARRTSGHHQPNMRSQQNITQTDDITGYLFLHEKFVRIPGTLE